MPRPRLLIGFPLPKPFLGQAGLGHYPDFGGNSNGQTNRNCVHRAFSTSMRSSSSSRYTQILLRDIECLVQSSRRLGSSFRRKVARLCAFQPGEQSAAEGSGGVADKGGEGPSAEVAHGLPQAVTQIVGDLPLQYVLGAEIRDRLSELALNPRGEGDGPD